MTIRLHRVHKSVGEGPRRAHVLRGVSAAFAAGCSVGILGLPRSGKSTLIKAIAGVAEPDAGRIERRGRVSLPVGSAAYLNRVMSGREMILFMARLHRIDHRPIVDFVRAFSGIGAALDEPMADWTRADRSAYLFSMSYGFPADFYVADEIILGGQGRFRERCGELIQARRRSAGFVFATAVPRYLELYADVGCVLHEGELEFHPTVAAAIKRFRQLRLAARVSEDLGARDVMTDFPEEG
ncbi:ATP-binding cassette domain-containing protein [Methylocella sp.]|uniref:ATP-binding cassette domain-containing protein n=1 Tax=Methylocella sp. TaxID=1978226 RepID=UPI0035AD9E92